MCVMVISCLQGGKVDKQEFVGNSLSLGEWRCGRSRAYEPGVRRGGDGFVGVVRS